MDGRIDRQTEPALKMEKLLLYRYHSHVQFVCCYRIYNGGKFIDRIFNTQAHINSMLNVASECLTGLMRSI